MTPNEPLLSPHASPHALSRPEKRNWTRDIVVIAVMVLIILGASAIFYFKDLKETITITYDAGSYQAVFLTNNQVYFGHIGEQNKDFIVLRDIYYLQLNNLQQQEESAGEKQTELSLIKLGNELHGPQDKMEINKSQILFIEDLKADSKVVQAIGNYQK